MNVDNYKFWFKRFHKKNRSVSRFTVKFHGIAILTPSKGGLTGKSYDKSPSGMITKSIVSQEFTSE